MPSFFIDVKERGAKKAEKNIKGLNVPFFVPSIYINHK